MRTTRRALRAVSILLASILALSCDNSFGILASIQKEKDQKGAKVFQKTSVKNAFKYKSRYYASTAVLSSRSAASTDWSTVGIDGSTDYFLRSAVLVGDDLTGSVYALAQKGDTVSLYGYDGATWTPVAGLPTQNLAGTAISSLEQLYSANGELYAVLHSYDASADASTDTSKYSLYHLVGTSLVSVTIFNEITAITRGVTFYDGNYWFAAANMLYSGANADGAGAADASASFTQLFTTSTATSAISSISATGSGANAALYIGTAGGSLYRYRTTDTLPVSSVTVASVPLTQVIEVPSSAGTTLLVGTDALGSTSADGYYEGSFGSFAQGSAGEVASNSTVYGQTVGSFPVRAFYYDGDATTGTLFVCVQPGSSSTKYYGLYASRWKADPEYPSTWSYWKAE
jgi:hypothetical protein